MLKSKDNHSKKMNESITSVFDNIIQKALEFTKEFYGDKLVSFVVYGSVGRGCPNPTSDIDLLIVAKRLPKGRRNRVRQFDKVESKLEPYLAEARKYEVYTRLSTIFKTKKEVLFGSPIFLDMVEDARILYDKDSFFSKYLSKFRKRLEKLGARRIKEGTRWYWDLKPDYKPGEIFEI